MTDKDLPEREPGVRRATTEELGAALAANRRSIDRRSGPQFAPDGDFDYYRAMWRQLGPRDDEQAEGATFKLKLYGWLPSNGESTMTNHLDITADQAERILKMLSEENRT